MVVNIGSPTFAKKIYRSLVQADMQSAVIYGLLMTARIFETLRRGDWHLIRRDAGKSRPVGISSRV
jgi:hypothetical protein